MDCGGDGNDGPMDGGGDGTDPPMDWRGDWNDPPIDSGEDEEQMTEQWIEEEMEKTDECIELEQEITTECFEKKQGMTDKWMEEEMTMRSTFQNILHASIASFVLTAAATWPALSFEAGKIDGTVQHTWNVPAAKNVSRDEGHQDGACEQTTTANRVFALATAEMSSFIGAEKNGYAFQQFQLPFFCTLWIKNIYR